MRPTPGLNGLGLSRPSRPRMLSLTPLIDVVFMLLLFFMLATSFSQWRVIDLLAANPGRGGASQKPAAVVLLRVFPDKVDVAGRATTMAAFVKGLAASRHTSGNQRVVLRIHDAVSAQRLVTVLDQLRRAGVDNPVLNIRPGPDLVNSAGE